MEEEISVKTTKCLNCGAEFEGKFCPQCGQRADTSRFTIRFIFTNLIQAILSNDGGVWITLKSLFTRPGQMMVDIINGKRKSYFSPFPMLFLALSLYVIIFTFTGSRKTDFDDLFVEDGVEVSITPESDAAHQAEAEKLGEGAKKFLTRFFEIYGNNYSVFFILTIPIYIFSARVVFGRKNRRTYNWGEYSIPIVYSLILLVLYRCIMSIVFYFSQYASELIDNFTIIMNVVVFTACFKRMVGFSIVKTAFLSFLMLVLYWIIFLTMIMLLAVIVTVIYFS